MKRPVKGMLSLAVAVAGVLGLGSMTAYAGEWKVDTNNGEYWYQNDDGSYTKNDWQLIDNKWYHFDENGYRQEGWWQFPTVHTYTMPDGTVYNDVYDEWYFLSMETGEMVANINWEGGCLCSDGTLATDEILINENGEVNYWRYMSDKTVPAVNMNANGNYTALIDWKSQMLKEWYSRLSPFGEHGSFSMDYQLPANWAEECPTPLMTAAINSMCFNAWGGDERERWTYSWNVDDNNVIHIEATNYYDY